MDVKLTEDQSRLIRSIALFEGFIEFNLETKSGSMKGDGYLGIITTVTIKNQNRKLNLILKSSQNNEELRKQAPIRQAYLREIFVYDTIFPEFKKFQIENGSLNPFSAHAGFYGSCAKERSECLVLENLKENGYQLWNRKVPMNSDHVALVFAEYGKFHSVSLALNNKKPELFAKLTENLRHPFAKSFPEEMFDTWVTTLVDTGAKAIVHNEQASKAYERFSKDILDFLKDIFEPNKDHLVVTHGDCWCNNMMFGYEDSKNIEKPSKMCFLDWQLSSYGSPFMDISYFMYTCAPKEILYDYEKYLKIYYENLAENLKSMSCNVEEIFPFELLKQHWKKYAKFGLYMSLMVLKISLSEADEVPDFSEIADSGKDMMEGLKFESINVNDYNQRIVDLVVFMDDSELI